MRVIVPVALLALAIAGWLLADSSRARRERSEDSTEVPAGPSGPVVRFPAEEPDPPARSEPTDLATLLKTEEKRLSELMPYHAVRANVLADAFEVGVLPEAELLWHRLERARLRIALDRGGFASPGRRDLEEAAARLTKPKTALYEAGRCSKAELDAVVGALSALQGSLRWYASPLRLGDAEVTAGPRDDELKPPVVEQDPSGRTPLIERVDQVADAALRESLERELAALGDAGEAITAEDAALSVRRLLARARLGRVEFEEAERRAREVLAALTLAPGELEDLEALALLFRWFAALEA